MNKVFHFESPRSVYQCDAAIVWCFDNRFDLSFSKFLGRRGIINSDPIKIAGGAKSLASPGRESERAFVLEQIRVSIRLHQTHRIILMLHSDCGAYGGLQAGFGGDPAQEADQQEQELRRAAAVVRETFPDLEVEAYFADFEGIWAVDIACPPAVPGPM